MGTPMLVGTFRCSACGAEVTLQGAARSRASDRGHHYCGDACRAVGHRAKISAILTGRKNGPPSAETRAKIAAANTDRTPVGWGGVPTKTEALLLTLLPGWTPHYTIQTKTGTRPRKYTIDLVHEAAKIGVELDGPGHNRESMHASDERKTAFLLSRGWYVVRIPNRAVHENPRLHAEVCLMLANVRGEAA